MASVYTCTQGDCFLKDGGCVIEIFMQWVFRKILYLIDLIFQLERNGEQMIYYVDRFSYLWSSAW